MDTPGDDGLFEGNQVDEGEPAPLLDLCSQEETVSAPDLIEEAWEQLDTWMTVNGLWADSPHPEQAGL